MEFINTFRLSVRTRPLRSILLLIVFFVPLIFSPFGGGAYEVTKFSSLCIGVGMLFWQLTKEFKEPFYYHKPTLILGVLFFGFYILSAILSSDHLASILGFYPRFNSSVLLTGLWLLLLLLLINEFARGKQEQGVKVAVFAATLVSLLGILESFGIGYYGGIQTLTEPSLERVPSLLGNPNFSSIFVATAVPLALVMAIEGTYLRAKLFYSVSVVLGVWACTLFSSRGGLLGLLFGYLLVFVYYFYQRKLRICLWLGIFGLCGFFIFSSWFNLVRPEVVGNTVSLTDINVTTRFTAWDSAIRMIQARPLLGVGPGNFQTFYIKMPSVSPSDTFFDDAHNFFLNVGATAGVPALLVLVLLFIVPIMLYVFKCRYLLNSITFGAIASLATFLLAASFNPITVGLWVLLALVLAVVVSPLAKGYKELNLSKFSKVIFITIGAVSIIYGLITVISDHLATSAMAKFTAQNYSEAFDIASKSSKLNPFDYVSPAIAAASTAHLNSNPELMEKYLNRIRYWREGQAQIYEITGNVYWIFYQATGKAEYADRAIFELKTQLKYNPKIALASTQIGYYLLSSGYAGLAESFVKQSLSDNPKQIVAWMLLAKIYQLDGKKPQMLFALSKAQALQPDFIQLKHLLEEARSTTDIKSLPISINLKEAIF